MSLQPYGAVGAVGSAVAEAFAREGGRVFLTGHDLAQVQRPAEKINDGDGHAGARQVGPRADLATRRHQW
jgi:NADP-dependent 3-hydroxy acid dehydrogenase YdfG